MAALLCLAMGDEMSSILPPQIGTWLENNEMAVSIIIMVFVILMLAITIIAFIKLDDQGGKHE
jgi:hypothetical protein